MIFVFSSWEATTIRLLMKAFIRIMLEEMELKRFVSFGEQKITSPAIMFLLFYFTQRAAKRVWDFGSHKRQKDIEGSKGD